MKTVGLKLFLSCCLLLFAIQARAEPVTGVVKHHVYFPVYLLESGQVSNVYADTGDVVSEEFVLIEMNSVSQSAAVGIQKSNVNRLSIELESKLAEFDRQQELFDRGSLSLLAYEDFENALKILEAQLAAAKAQLRKADYELSLTRIKAPFDAVVLKRRVHPGMNIRADYRSKPLMVLASAKAFAAELIVEQTKWQSLKQLGLPSEVTVDGAAYPVDIETSGFNYQRTKQGIEYRIILVFHDESGMVFPGQSVSVEF